MYRKNEKAITLIALIITIIVMLILVGVTISVALNGGLFKKAKTASDQMQIEADREELLSAVVGAMDSNGNIVLSDLEEELGTEWTHTGDSLPCTFTKVKTGNSFTVLADGTIVVGSDNNPGEEEEEQDNTPSTYAKAEDLTLGTGVSLVPYGELTGDIKTAVDSEKVKAVLTENINSTPTIAVVPTGFTVSSTSGENTISGGLVVEDGSHNQFVWIPVPTLSDMAVETEVNSDNYRGVLYDWVTDSTGATQMSYNSNSGYREPANLTGTVPQQSYLYDSQDAFIAYVGETYSDTMYQTEYNQMATSVGKYKGFYVGRYETGGFNGSTIVVKAGETGTTDSSSADNSINNVTWYKMYQMQKNFASGNTSVASTMIWGCQWDQVMKFVDEKEDGEGNTYDVTEARTTSGSTRHTNSLAATGNNINDKVQNIYDLEGNLFEWTLEADDTEYRVVRGGSCYHSYYSANRFSYSPHNSIYYRREPYHTLYKVMLIVFKILNIKKLPII